MSLNLKNPETHRLAKELANLTGESLTTAITTAVSERLERVRRTKKQRLSERLLEIGKDCAAHLNANVKVLDHGAFLYDEEGMPR